MMQHKQRPPYRKDHPWRTAADRRGELLLAGNSNLHPVILSEQMQVASNGVNDAAVYLERGHRYFDQGDFHKAIATYTQALRLAPNMVEARFKCGVANHRMGYFKEAIYHYRQALQENPELAEIHYNLADACMEMKLLDCAESAYLNAIRLQPGSSAAHYNLGHLFQSLGRNTEALAAFERALQLRPDYAEALVSIGMIWRAQGRFEEALICFEQGVRCNPGLVEAGYNLGFTYQLMGELNTARQIYRRLLDDHPDYAPALWMYKLGLPLIYRDGFEIQQERDRFARNLHELIQTTSLDDAKGHQSALAGLSVYTNYFLAHQGCNDLTLQQSFGRWATAIMSAKYPQWAQKRPPMPVAPGQKIRIGFVSASMYAHSVGLFLLAWLKYMGLSDLRNGTEDMSFFCYHIGTHTDELTHRIERLADRFHYFKDNVDDAAAQIDRDGLHILVHTDVGVTPATVQLAALRLAPVQCTFWGHPVTTGLPTIDYFFSSELMEPDDGAAHYSETLIRLPGLAMHYAGPNLPEMPKNREKLGIPEDAVVYLNSQSLPKYLPQHDDIFPRIARENPKALFVFFSNAHESVTAGFRKRLETAFRQHGVPANILILPRMAHADFLSVNLAADVFLDTFEWSGGQSTLDALACDLPVVTLPGPYMRGRQSYGFLRHIGATETVAVDKDDYIRLAVRLGLDSDFRAAIRRRIRARKTRLFEDHAVNGVLVDLFRRWVAQPPHGPPQPDRPEENLQSLFEAAAALATQGKMDEAASLYRRLIECEPNFSLAVNNLGGLYHQQGRFEEALPYYRRLVELEPQMPQAHYNLGSTLRFCEHFEQALIHLQRAVALQPDFAEAWNNLALTWKNIGELDHSLACFDQAVALAPKLAVARWNRSFVHMLKQDYEHGWFDFLWRFAIPDWKTIYPYRLQGKRWDGRPLPGRTILVHDEQGLGDTLQFVRYLPLVRARCGKVILETRRELIDVLATANGIDQLIVRSADGRPEAQYDAYVPLMNLPLLFGTTFNNMPDLVPYLSADAAKMDYWRRTLPTGRPKVGLVWAGRPQHTNDRNRSIALTQLLPLLRTPEIDFIGLQKGPAAEQIGELPPDARMTGVGETLRDFSDTAALLTNLDLLITVDTAVAHLAGAMGRPVWMLVPFIPDWRWAMDRPDTPWYPTMRLFRQPQRKAWEPVIADVARALTRLFCFTGKQNSGESGP